MKKTECPSLVCLRDADATFNKLPKFCNVEIAK